MKLKPFCATLVAAALMLAACGDDAATTAADENDEVVTSAPVGDSEETSQVEKTQRFWIGSELVDCQGEAPQKCMQIAKSEDGDYEFFYDQIEGFTFEEGTSYVIDVAVDEIEDPPADGSSLRYTLVKIVEQT